jgi:hypothetical protein
MFNPQNKKFRSALKHTRWHRLVLASLFLGRRLYYPLRGRLQRASAGSRVLRQIAFAASIGGLCRHIIVRRATERAMAIRPPSIRFPQASFATRGHLFFHPVAILTWSRSGGAKWLPIPKPLLGIRHTGSHVEACRNPGRRILAARH